MIRVSVDEALRTLRTAAIRAQCNQRHTRLRDLQELGLVELVLLMQRFDPRVGVPFHAFAYQRLVGVMLDAIRQEARRARILSEHVREYHFSDEVELFEEGRDLHRALDALSDADRRLLVSVYGEGRAVREVCPQDISARELRKVLDRLESARQQVMARVAA